LLGYDGVPLEMNAYGLGGRFERNPRAQFSVADESGTHATTNVGESPATFITIEFN
jgi:hypothetical protein